LYGILHHKILIKDLEFDIDESLESQCNGPYHEWGSDFNFRRLDTAGIYIQDYVYKYSMCRLSWKEKYGTIRYEFLIPSRWCWYMCNCWIYYKWIKLGQYFLKKAIRKAIIKFPDMKDEILDDYLWMENL
jgi:hypothetical protein